jgi:hypothetical protein
MGSNSIYDQYTQGQPITASFEVVDSTPLREREGFGKQNRHSGVEDVLTYIEYLDSTLRENTKTIVTEVGSGFKTLGGVFQNNFKGLEVIIQDGFKAIATQSNKEKEKQKEHQTQTQKDQTQTNRHLEDIAEHTEATAKETRRQRKSIFAMLQGSKAVEKTKQSTGLDFGKKGMGTMLGGAGLGALTGLMSGGGLSGAIMGALGGAALGPMGGLIAGLGSSLFTKEQMKKIGPVGGAALGGFLGLQIGIKEAVGGAVLGYVVGGLASAEGENIGERFKNWLGFEKEGGIAKMIGEKLLSAIGLEEHAKSISTFLGDHKGAISMALIGSKFGLTGALLGAAIGGIGDVLSATKKAQALSGPTTEAGKEAQKAFNAGKSQEKTEIRDIIKNNPQVVINRAGMKDWDEIAKIQEQRHRIRGRIGEERIGGVNLNTEEEMAKFRAMALGQEAKEKAQDASGVSPAQMMESVQSAQISQTVPPSTDLANPEMKDRAGIFFDLAKEEGIDVVLTEGDRSTARQQYLNDTLRAKGARVAPVGSSLHEQGLAFDVLAKKNGKIVHDSNDPIYSELGELASEAGLENPIANDKGHFQVMSDQREIVKASGNAGGSNSSSGYSEASISVSPTASPITSKDEEQYATSQNSSAPLVVAPVDNSTTPITVNSPASNGGGGHNWLASLNLVNTAFGTPAFGGF